MHGFLNPRHGGWEPWGRSCVEARGGRTGGVLHPKRGKVKDLVMCCTKRLGGLVHLSLVLTEKHHPFADT
eukprot:9432647-Pyramimonas_sp.AAC.1